MTTSIRARLLNFSYLRLWQQAWIYADRKDRRIIIMYHLMYVVAATIYLIQPYLLGKLVNALQNGGPDLFHHALMLLIFIVLTMIGFWSFHGPGRIMERRVAKNVYIAYTSECYRRLTELPLGWHQDHHSGATINRIQTSATSLQTFVENGYDSFQKLWLLAGAMVMLLWFNIIIGLISLAGFAAGMLFVIVMNKKFVSAVHALNEVSHQANATFYDFVSNMGSIIILRLQKFSEATLRSKLALSITPWMRQTSINEFRWGIYSLLNTIMMAIILLGYIKAQVDIHAALAAGSLVTVYLYQGQVNNQGSGFLQIHSEWLRYEANLGSTKNILDDYTKLVKSRPQAPSPDWKQLEIRNLLFNYPMDNGDIKTVLKNIDLPIRRGERIALIGDSGAGKSTLLTLLRALRAPQQVELLVDGKPAPFDTLSEITTLVPQDPEIFENTIRFNVSFDLGVPDEQVYQAIRLAEFGAVLAQMPSKLDTDIREKGVNLSVGQKQRLALARGIFAAEQSDIILLDEPTSSVDLPTEEKIFNSIFAHFKGKTIVATLHRLHLLTMFDRIVYLSGGHVLSDLPVREALSAPGPIRDLYMTYQRQKTA
jgi:ATP-binding cassette subfamily B protein